MNEILVSVCFSVLQFSTALKETHLPELNSVRLTVPQHPILQELVELEVLARLHSQAGDTRVRGAALASTSDK